MVAIDAAQLYQPLEATRPLAARLALLASLPVRVSPALLRLVRLRLVPQGGIGDEADLWLSDLVETRSAAGFALRPAVRAYLRERLREDAALLDAVWQRVHVEHAPWTLPRTRLEEELTWRLLRQRDDETIEAIWAGVVQELDVGTNAEGVARWVVRATADLPEGTLDHASGRRAYFGSHLLLGDTSVLGKEPQRFLASGEFAFATRRLPRRRIFVGLVGGQILVSPLLQIKNAHAIDVPLTQPLWLQLEPQGDTSFRQAEPTVLTIADNEPVQADTMSTLVVLRGIDGAAYELGPLRPSSQRSILDRRAPLVHITYEVEHDGAIKEIELPFVVGVLADLSGSPSQPFPELEDRKFLEIDANNFESRLKAFLPRVDLRVLADDGTTNTRVELTFEGLDDFSPAALARNVPALRTLLEQRQQLAGLLVAMEGRTEAVRVLGDALQDPLLLRTLADSDPEVRTEFDAYAVDAFKPRTADAERTLAHGIRALAAQALASAPPAAVDIVRFITETVARVDAQLAGRVNRILHHPDLQQLEGTWRGLYNLVRNTETGETLKIRILNISKSDLGETLARYRGARWDQSPIFKKVYEEEFGKLGGEPFGCLVGDYYFTSSALDVVLLGEMAKVCAAAHCPFIAGASSSVLQIQSWEELADRSFDVSAPFRTPTYAAWQSLRESSEAMYIGLAMPRILARLPYGAKTDPVEEFAFEEDTDGADNARYTWTNAAYAMALNIANSFKRYGWTSQIRGLESGGMVERLPVRTVPYDDGRVSMVSSTEVTIIDRQEFELSRNGLLPLVQYLNRDIAVFFGASSLQKPAVYDDPQSTATAKLAAQLPHLLACCRFAHYLQCIVRDKIGTFKSGEDMQQCLQAWIAKYVDAEPENSTEEAKARLPLAAATVHILEMPGRPGAYTARLSLRPQYRLERSAAPFHMEVRLPAIST